MVGKLVVEATAVHQAGQPVVVGEVGQATFVESVALLATMGADVELEVYDDTEHLVSDRAVASTRRLLFAAIAARSVRRTR